MTSTMLADARRSGGTNLNSSFTSGRISGESAAWTIAAPWKLTVAGGIGATSDNTPPRRTITVTATRPRLPCGRDVAEDGERRLGHLSPDLFAGKGRRHGLAVAPGGWAAHDVDGRLLV